MPAPSVHDFEKLETEISKVVYRQTPNEPLSQYDLYKELLDVYEISAPDLKNHLKMNMLIVMRTLPHHYPGIKTVQNGETTSLVLLDEDKPFREEDYVIPSTPVATGKTVPVKQSESMPLEKEVIFWIVDNDIDYSITKEDLKGNTILHYLVKLSDIDRIKKILVKYPKLTFFDRNQEGIAPIDLITDQKINLLIFNMLFEKINNIEKREKDLQQELNSFSNQIVFAIKNSDTMTFFLLIAIAFLYVKTFLM